MKPTMQAVARKSMQCQYLLRPPQTLLTPLLLKTAFEEPQLEPRPLLTVRFRFAIFR